MAVNVLRANDGEVRHVPVSKCDIVLRQNITHNCVIEMLFLPSNESGRYHFAHVLPCTPSFI